ncbi:poly(A)-specific ribonuclease PNLDC1-like [Asterias rubens]|uniref:poly(A)-specific ribonuclease PNLDC1-like n=1 Tax=Asterias rubens TaxID=7604 RepID=UPI00145562C8|nr:poly(A)-specific ribonuclease PNLDC1-like [Asterias rubens]
MTNVTRNNFEELLPEIISSIEASEFVAIDTEFTGLHFERDSFNSLFDTTQDRYKKLRQTATQFTICQLGLSAFVKVPSKQKYAAHTYNFYLFPRSCSVIDARFTCQASSIQFLCQYKFDFNKLFHEGVTYVSTEEAEGLRQQAEQHETILTSDVDRDLIKSLSSPLSKWLPSAKDGDQISMAKIQDDILSIQVQALLRNYFPTIWTSKVNTGEILITKVTPEQRANLLAAEPPWTERLLDRIDGFTKVFRCLSESKKPLIGHNLLTDLLFLHAKFHKPLPEKLNDFKRNIHELFPHIFDTKHLILKIRKELEERGLSLSITSLEQVYRNLHSHRGKYLVLYSPDIVLADNALRYSENELFHEAGFDAYLAGYVFLRMAHYIAAKDTSALESTPLPFSSYLPALAEYENKINLIRAHMPYLSLAGDDPASFLPKLLYVTARGRSPLHAMELTAKMEALTSADVKMIDRRHALVATATYGGSKDILRAFKNDKGMHIAYYNILQHSKPIRYGLWGAVAALGAVCVWTLLGESPKKT